MNNDEDKEVYDHSNHIIQVAFITHDKPTVF